MVLGGVCIVPRLEQDCCSEAITGGGGVSRGIFGDNCVHIAKERLWSQGENASKRQDVCRGEYLAIIAYVWRKRDYGRRGKNASKRQNWGI